MVWGFKWLKFFLNPFGDESFEHISEEDRRAYMIHRLETAKRKEYSWVIVVAGVGFFTDAYCLFAINMVLPILGIIYYGGTMPHKYETALSVVTLGGSIIGQIIFGLGADIWGRRKMYGVELIITVGGTLGVVMASNGIDGSMSVIVWLLLWRFVVGIGIGADYPLSAVICSEFAPTRLRGRMLTLVFACQPLGQLAATIVALVASVRQRNGIPVDSTQSDCNAECTRTLDSIWRWIIGVGVIPAVIALWFRLTIIESPRYTADVTRDSAKAASELKRYLMASPQMELAFSTSIENHNESTYQRAPVRRSTSSGARSGSQNNAELDEGLQDLQALSRRSSGALSVNPAEKGRNEATQEMQPMRRTSSGAISLESGARSDDGIDPHNPPTEEHNLMQVEHDAAEGSSSVSPIPQVIASAQTGTFLAADAGSYHQRGLEPTFYQDDPEANLEFNMSRLSQQATKQLYMTSSGHAFPGMSMNNNMMKVISEDHRQPPPPSWADFKDYFWHKGNLRTLIATSICWFCVDLPFYGLGLNSPHIITKVWYGQKPPVQSVYALLVNNVWQSLVVVSTGAIVGVSITFVAIDRLGRRWIQMIGFFWLFILFIVIGSSFYHLYEIGGQAAIVVLYILCQIFFNFGPNTTTYILPAELFPTRYRALCHGISAASGKLGSVVAQVFLAYINYGHGINYNQISKWLPYSLLMFVSTLLDFFALSSPFSIFMLIGLYITIIWIPAQENSLNGTVKTLEQWQKGRFPEKDYSDTKWGKIVVKIWKLFAKLGDIVYLILDGLSGGDEKEKRKGKVVDGSDDHEHARDDRELDVIDDRGRERGRSRGDNVPEQSTRADGEVRPFVNGSVGHS